MIRPTSMMGMQPGVKAAKSRAGLKNRDRRTSVHGNVWSRGLALQLSTKRNTDATFDRSAPFLPITASIFFVGAFVRASAL